MEADYTKLIKELYPEPKKRKSKFKIIDRKILFISSLGASIAGFGSVMITSGWQLMQYAYNAALYLYHTKTLELDPVQLKEILTYYSNDFISKTFNSFVTAFSQNLAGYYASLKIISHYLNKLFGGDSDER